jgi:hypothetical protein
MIVVVAPSLHSDSAPWPLTFRSANRQHRYISRVGTKCFKTHVIYHKSHVTCQCLHELCLSESALSAVQPRPLLQLKAMSEVHLTPHVTRQMSHGIIPDSAVRATQEITPHMEQHRDMQDGRRAANTTGLMLLSKAMLTPLAAGGSSFCVHVAVVAAGGTARRSPRLWGTHSRARQATR